MKVLQIALLLGAGALAGTVITRLWLRPQRPATRAAMASAPPSVPAKELPQLPSPAASPTLEEPLPPTPPIAAAPRIHPSSSHDTKAARKAPTFRRIQPASKPTPMVLAKVKTEPAVVPPPVSAPPVIVAPPTIVPGPAAEPRNPTSPQASPNKPSPHQVTLYTGLLIPVRLVDGLSSDKNQPGDTFTATIDHEIVVDGFVIVERGAPVEGRVTAVDRGSARLTVELTRLFTADRQRVAIQTESFERRTDAAGESEMRGRSTPATLPADTRIRFRLRTSILLTEKLG